VKPPHHVAASRGTFDQRTARRTVLSAAGKFARACGSSTRAARLHASMPADSGVYACRFCGASIAGRVSLALHERTHITGPMERSPTRTSRRGHPARRDSYRSRVDMASAMLSSACSWATAGYALLAAARSVSSMNSRSKPNLWIPLTAALNRLASVALWGRSSGAVVHVKPEARGRSILDGSLAPVQRLLAVSRAGRSAPSLGRQSRFAILR